MGHGTKIEGPSGQVQRARAGVEHAEFNWNGEKGEQIQLWFAPPKKGLEPCYQDFKLEPSKLTTVLGGNDPHTFNNTMTCQIGLLEEGNTLEFVAHTPRGHVLIQNTGTF